MHLLELTYTRLLITMTIITLRGLLILGVIIANVSADVIVCEDELAYIKCSYPSKIKVSSAVYGRTTDRRICPHHSIRTTDCRSSTSDNKVKAMCNGKRICRVKADHRQFGDPCSGTYKYLEVKYECV
ncbi:L-rhamnose-binding lectin ELEL-1-like [Mytilus galloprovincialis]|uniref:L-rhamnose-binding lectin ELEL-1-like n=1 Tax=Mytilus galloprovincialis TaxID=29158 RepID=UPI003F7BAA34